MGIHASKRALLHRIDISWLHSIGSTWDVYPIRTVQTAPEAWTCVCCRSVLIVVECQHCMELCPHRGEVPELGTCLSEAATDGSGAKHSQRRYFRVSTPRRADWRLPV